ncbi:MAG: RIP metalloprotease RseP [Rhodobacteraceae bacterium]|nr:RIP metalloprotease RseP [Paracoccaceae bacterium]
MDLVGLIPAAGGFVWTIIVFVIALSIIVAIHEYGHYIVGRWSGIKADVFSIGFGPVVWSRYDKHGTRWQIAALPFGGFVKFAGDANAASGKDEAAMAEAAADPEAMRSTMHGAPLWARAATVAAGPVFNFILSFLIFGSVLLFSGVTRDPLTVGQLWSIPEATQQLETGDVILKIEGEDVPSVRETGFSDFIASLPVQRQLTYTIERDGAMRDVEGPYFMPTRIQAITPQSAAFDAGLRRNDVITAVDGEPIFAFSQLKSAVEGSNGAPLALSVWRDGENVALDLTAKRVDEPQPEGGFATQWRIGIVAGNAFEPATSAPGFGEAITGGLAQTWRIIDGSISGLTHIITGAISSCNLTGPIGIAQTSSAMASQGAESFIWFIAVLSTAVGLLNLFPIPALDGGHLVFYAYEAVAGRPPSDRALRVLMAGGLALVLSLMVFALGNDLFCP